MSPVRLDSNSEDDPPISWLEADPGRAPVRNDVITGLEAALCPLPFWFVFFNLNYHPRAAVLATAFVAVASFAVVFVVSWARMTTARHTRASIRTRRTRARAALLGGLAVALVTFVASPSRHGDQILDAAVGLALGVVAALIALGLEQFAVSVPRASKRLDLGLLIRDEGSWTTT